MRPWIHSLLFLLAAGAPVVADGGDFVIEDYTIDGGGGRMSGESFTVEGTLGQPEAHPAEARGGSYSVAGGYWATTQATYLFSDGFEG